jgi:hypothetical protein
MFMIGRNDFWALLSSRFLFLFLYSKVDSAGLILEPSKAPRLPRKGLTQVGEIYLSTRGWIGG